MARGQLEPVLHQLRRMTALAGTQELTDAQLLERYVAGRDEDAFATLVHRHGRLVRSVCRQVLHHEADSEDAFQATFFVFAVRAASIRKGGALASWLYGVAYRTAMNARRARKRHGTEQAAPEVCGKEQPVTEAALREVQAILAHEVNRLPEKQRRPFVLCCLEGKSRAEAARELGWKEGTISSCLARARTVLQQRLSRRGIALSAALCAAELSRTAATAAVAPGLAHQTIQAALAFAGGKSLASAAVVGLARGVLRSMTLAGRHIATIVLLAAGILAGAAAIAHQSLFSEPPSVQADDPAPRRGLEKRASTDALGDPLPPGALVRLGTSRLRTSRHHRFAPDDRRLVLGTAEGDLQIYEAPSGKPLTRLRATDVPQRDQIVGSTLGFSPDGKYLAAVCWKGRCGIWDTTTGQLVRWLESGLFYSIVRCDFAPDGKLLAVGNASSNLRTDDITVDVYEVETGRRLFSVLGANSVFAPDGKSLVAWNGYTHGARDTARRVAIPSGEILTTFAYVNRHDGFRPPTDGTWFFEPLQDRVRVWDVPTSKVAHTFRGVQVGADRAVSVHHAPGRREMIAVGTQPPAVACWDLQTGQELWQVALPMPAQAPQLSANGTTFVFGDMAGRVHVWDAVTGTERTRFQPRSIGHDANVRIFPDGKLITTTSGGIFTSAIAFWDAATGKRVSHLPGHASGISATTFALDGRTIYTIARDRTLRAWDARTGQEQSHFAAEPAPYLALAPDGKTHFAAGRDDSAMRVLDARSGTLVRRFPTFDRPLAGLALSADGKRLVTAGRMKDDTADRIRIQDAATGAMLREFSAGEASLEQLALRPDGRILATTHVGQRVILWDASGKKLSEQVGQGKRQSAWVEGETPYRIGAVALAPQGPWLAYADQEQGVALVNTDSGRETGRVKPAAEYQIPAPRYELREVLAFAPDGKSLAWSGMEHTSEIYLIEARTAQVRRRLPGDSAPVQQLTFSPDGTRLLSAGPDGAALVWDLHVAGKPAASASSDWWDALADPNAEKAFGAMQAMAAQPAAAVALVRQKLRPVRAVEAARLDALLTQLDGPVFQGREAASRELIALGDAAVPRLRAALQGTTSVELKRRAASILDEIDATRLRPERAVETLEMIGNPAALALVQKLAAGLPGAGLTTDATGAVARLALRRDGAR